MRSFHIIDFVVFFTVDSPLLLKTLHPYLLGIRLFWFFSRITPVLHHLLGVGTPMVQSDIPFFSLITLPS